MAVMTLTDILAWGQAHDYPLLILDGGERFEARAQSWQALKEAPAVLVMKVAAHIALWECVEKVVLSQGE